MIDHIVTGPQPHVGWHSHDNATSWSNDVTSFFQNVYIVLDMLDHIQKKRRLHLEVGSREVVYLHLEDVV